MFEEQSHKLYSGLDDKVNNLFSKKPFVSSLILSILVSLLVFLVSLDYKRGEAQIEISEEGSLENDSTVGEKLKSVKVDLSGAVKNPGVYSLDSSSRISDLVRLGGGFIDDASALWVSKNLNLSQIVADGQKVYIPFEWDISGLDDNKGLKALSLAATPGSEDTDTIIETYSIVLPETSSSTTKAKGLNVNNATASELDALPGVGPSYAGRIVENRPYASFDVFKEKSDLPLSLCESLKDFVSY